jgi:acetylornithine aminotransferase
MDNLEKLDKQYLMNTYNKDYTNFTKGKNATLYDENGDDYIDFISGIAVISAGHSNEKINNAIKEQIDNLTHISNLFVIQPQVQLAKKISNKLDDKYNTFFCNSGTEANEGAIKIARKYGEIENEIKRYKIITLEHSFHGRTITSLKATGQTSMHTYFGPFPDGFTYAKNIEDIQNKIDDKTIAVMIELIQGEGGVEMFDIKQVQALEKLCKQKDILLIVDEVQTGIYRCGEFLLSNLYNITPDIITLAKGLGNGIPIGAILTTKKDVLSFGTHGSTFGGNFISTTASLKTIEILENIKDTKQLDDTIEYFSKKMDELESKFKNILKKQVGIGMLRGFRLENQDILTKVIQKAKENKLLLLKAGRNTLRILPTLTITKDEIDLGFDRFEKTLENI